MRRLAALFLFAFLILTACAPSTTVPTDQAATALEEAATPEPTLTGTETPLPATDVPTQEPPTPTLEPDAPWSRDAYWVIGESYDGKYLAYWERLPGDPHNVRLCIIYSKDDHYCDDAMVVHDSFLRKDETAWAEYTYSIGFLKYNPNGTAALVVYDAVNQITTTVGLQNNDAFRSHLRSDGYSWTYTGSSSDTNFCGASKVFTTDGETDPTVLDENYNVSGVDFADYQAGGYGHMVREGCVGSWEYVLTIGFEDYPIAEATTRPLLSPSGDAVLYLIDEGLVSLSPEVSDRWVITHSWPDAYAFSSDGKYVAYDLYNDGVYLVSTDDTTGRTPVKVASLTEGHWLTFWGNNIVAYNGYSMTVIDIP